jgi:Tol biopolymer transport system component/DNA-binding winged helix-turn-helix (wHTH) protein
MQPSIRGGANGPAPRPQRMAFDDFEVDVRAGELRKHGSKIRLQAQPFQLLVLLLQNAGEVVTREEISREIWGENTFVDFEHGLAAAVNKVREALGDSAASPKYIETLPKRGYRFIGKLKPEPRAVMPLAVAAETSEPEAPAAAQPGFASARYAAIAFCALAILVAAAIVLWPRPNAAKSAEPIVAVPFTSYVGVETAPAISPDGTRIAFSWDNDSTNKTDKPLYDLYVKAIGSETLVQLTHHPADWISSAWSPDGSQIAFHRLASDGTGIYVVPALGGPERKLLETHAPYNLAAPLSWSPDGKWLAFADRKPDKFSDRTFLLNVETLEVHEYPLGPDCLHQGSLTFSNSGSEVALLCVHNLNNIEYRIGDPDGKSVRSLRAVPDVPYGMAWSGDNRSIVVAVNTTKGAALREIGLDGSTRILPSVSGLWPTISRDGSKLAYSVSNLQINVWKKDLKHPELAPEMLFRSSHQQNEASYSPDGQHMVFDSDRSGVWSIWLADADGNNLVQLTHDRPAGYPMWSPNSKSIAFEMTEDGGSEAVYTADILDRVPHKLETGLSASSAPSWSRDGKWIYFRAYEGRGHQIYRVDPKGGRAILVVAGKEDDAPFESPDGKTLFFAWNSATYDVAALPVNTPGAKPQSLPGLDDLSSSNQWAVVSGGIYFVPLNEPRAVYFYDFASHQRHEVFRAAKDLNDGLTISPDGRYLLYSQVDQIDADIMLVDNFHLPR